MGSPGGSDGKESACNVGDLGSISGLGRSSGAGHDNLLQYSCLENPHGERSLAGYRPRGPTESDVTKHTQLHVYTEAGSTSGAQWLSSRLTLVLLCHL